MIVAILGGMVVSMLTGLLLASYAVAGGTTSYLPIPASGATCVDRDDVPELTTVQQIAARVSAARADGGKL